MIVGGFQKMTMLDFPGKIACTVFTYGCNFRCPFCHNASLVVDEADTVSEKEIMDYLEKRKKMLDGVCITGGEPMLQKGLFDFMKRVKELGLLVKLDTNGSFPELLKKAIDDGLVDYVAMDIKAPKEKYGEVIGVPSFDVSPIEKSVEILKNSAIDYEFRTTVVKELHSLDDIIKIGEWLRGSKKYFLQNFVDSGNLIGNGLSAHEKSTLEAFKQAVFGDFRQCEIRGV